MALQIGGGPTGRSGLRVEQSDVPDEAIETEFREQKVVGYVIMRMGAKVLDQVFLTRKHAEETLHFGGADGRGYRIEPVYE